MKAVLRNWPFLLMLTLAAPMGAGVTWIITEPDPARDPNPSASAHQLSATTSGAAEVSPTKYAESLSPKASDLLEPYIVTGIDAVLYDGLTFGPEGAARTRITGLVGPTRDGVCEDDDKRLWACGLQARAALNNLIRRERVLCTPVRPIVDQVLEARCSVDGRDLGLELAKAGFARSVAPSLKTASAEANAAEERRGLWNGGWTIRR